MGRLAWLAVTCVVAGAALLPACSGGADEGDAALFCERLDRLTRNDPFQAFGDIASSEDVEIAFAALLERADELVDVAPPEARAAARDFEDAARALDSLLAGAAYEPAQVDAREYRNEQLAYLGAAQRLQNHLDAEC